ncbi:DUF5999 family protein [Streptomyces virginiae]|uniref:DUF5999 family protein n=1 Tax=Streptomyces virginiae TaxID=1961 RepID=UPI00365D4C68
MNQSKPPTCPHSPPCPPAEALTRGSAVVVASHPEQGWTLLCNGVLEFEDTGQLLPNGKTVAPHRPTGGTQAAA